jgi:RNA polymerase sigma factor (sigma-70 family)
MDNLSDSQLVAAALSGNRSAFSILIERYHAMVLQLAYRTIGQYDLAHDLAQETFLQAFLSLSQLRDQQRFRSWLYGITLHVCRDFLRSQRANLLSYESLAGGVHIADDMPSPEMLAEQIELRQTVQRALQSLTESNRATVLLFYYEGFNTREIADLLEISVSAVKVRLHKARQQLKTYLEAVLPIVQHTDGARNMLPVIVADVHREFSMAEEGQKQNTQQQVILFDEQSRRALVIWIGEIEAMSITLGMVRNTSRMNNRPMTQQLIANLLKTTGATVEAIEINKIERDIYYATIKIKTESGVVGDVDARPSDALAIAVWNDIPIFADDTLLKERGVVVPEGKSAHRRGVENWIKNLYTGTPVVEKKPLSPEEIEALKKMQPDEAEQRRQFQEMAQKVIEATFE